MNRRSRTLSVRPLELLDERIVPSTVAVPSPQQVAVVEAKGGQALGSLYSQYASFEQSGGTGSFSPTNVGDIVYNPGNQTVEVDVTFGSGNIQSLASQMAGIGASNVSVFNNTVEATVPISTLPTLLTNSHESSLSPVSGPIQSSSSTSASDQQETMVTAKAGNQLGSLYQQYMAYTTSGSTRGFSPTGVGNIINNPSAGTVRVDVTFGSGNIQSLASQMAGIGASNISVFNNTIEADVPISQLPTLLSNSHESTMAPVYKPILS